MASIYSARFLEGVGTTVGGEYTVPDNYVAVVRYFGVTVGVSTLGQVATLYTAHGGRLYILGSQMATTAAESFYWEGRVVYYAGEPITVTVDGELDYYVGGYLLAAP